MIEARTRQQCNAHRRLRIKYRGSSESISGCRPPCGSATEVKRGNHEDLAPPSEPPTQIPFASDPLPFEPKADPADLQSTEWHLAPGLNAEPTSAGVGRRARKPIEHSPCPSFIGRQDRRHSSRACRVEQTPTEIAEHLFFPTADARAAAQSN
jgi:hypothetical protein